MTTNADSSWPLVLSAEATIPSQTTQKPPQLALMNPTGEAFRIHEIRYDLASETATVNYATGATIGCKLELGTVALTNGFIPVWNFGRVTSDDQDLNNQFAWKLAHPLYIPAGALLSPTFQHFGQISGSVTARISVFGSSVRDGTMPRRVFLPWVAAYLGKIFQFDSDDTDTSRETDLVNPFDSPISISRLIGRFNVFATNTQSNYSRSGGQLLRLRISLSNGDPLVRTLTPLPQVFGQDGRAWEQRNTILKPKQYFQVYVVKDAEATASSIPTIQPFVSMVGYREMEIAGYANQASGVRLQ